MFYGAHASETFESSTLSLMGSIEIWNFVVFFLTLERKRIDWSTRSLVIRVCISKLKTTWRYCNKAIQASLVYTFLQNQSLLCTNHVVYESRVAQFLFAISTTYGSFPVLLLHIIPESNFFPPNLVWKFVIWNFQ